MVRVLYGAGVCIMSKKGRSTSVYVFVGVCVWNRETNNNKKAACQISRVGKYHTVVHTLWKRARLLLKSCHHTAFQWK